MQRWARPNGVGGAWRWWAATLVLVVAFLGGGCKADKQGQLPETSGEKIAAQRAKPVGFGLVSAYADQLGDEHAIALEFSRRLVGTQDFDKLIAVTDKDGAAVAGSWVLSDRGDGKGRSCAFRTSPPIAITPW